MTKNYRSSPYIGTNTKDLHDSEILKGITKDEIENKLLDGLCKELKLLMKTDRSELLNYCTFDED